MSRPAGWQAAVRPTASSTMRAHTHQQDQGEHKREPGPITNREPKVCSVVVLTPPPPPSAPTAFHHGLTMKSRKRSHRPPSMTTFTASPSNTRITTHRQSRARVAEPTIKTNRHHHWYDHDHHGAHNGAPRATRTSQSARPAPTYRTITTGPRERTIEHGTTDTPAGPAQLVDELSPAPSRDPSQRCPIPLTPAV